MDEKKLKALRDKYAGASGGDVADPAFKQVSDQLFASRGHRAPPYSGIPTLLDLPHQSEADGLDIAAIGVPMDLGVTNRSGARFGPRALRTIERVGPYNHVLKVTPTTLAKIADLGDVAFSSRFDLTQSIRDIELFFAGVIKTGARTLAVGGDHSITYPILKAVATRHGPVALVHIDAHCDTGGEYDGSKFHHGGPFRLATLDGAIDPQRTVQIGIRGSAEFLWEFSHDAGMTVIHMERLAEMGMAQVIALTRKVVGDGPVYVSFDVDGLDPAFVPGTGTPEVGGLTPREALTLLRGLAGLNVIGGDVVEVAPQYDPTTNSAHVGAQMLFEILSLMVVKA